MGWRRVIEYVAVLFGLGLVLCGGVLCMIFAMRGLFSQSLLDGSVALLAVGGWISVGVVAMAVLWVLSERREHRAMMSWILSHDGSDGAPEDGDPYLDQERSAGVLLREQRAGRVRSWAMRLVCVALMVFVAM